MTHLPPSIRSFASIEQLDALPRELGWPLEYRQIEPGSFSSTFTDAEGDSWFLMEEQSSRSVECVAGAPQGMFMLALVEGAPLVIDGRTLSADKIFLQTPGSDFRAIVPGETRITQLGVAQELFEDVIQAVAPELVVSRGGTDLFAAAASRLASVRRNMRIAISAPSSQKASRDETASRILADFIAVACDHATVDPGHDLHRANARRALDRAMEYIEAHMGETIRIAPMCAYSGTTLRSLQRIFSRELGVSPQQYVMARRLNAVRRRLLAAGRDQDLRVTDVAQDLGFAHLGRFAGDYRRYFGESPQETLLGR